MSSYLRNLLLLLIAVILCTTLAGCERKNPGANGSARTGNNTIAIVVNGREFRAVSDGSASVSVQSNGLLISYLTHAFAIEEDRILLDGVEIAACPATAAKVEIQLANGRVTVMADGTTVVTKQLDD